MDIDKAQKRLQEIETRMAELEDECEDNGGKATPEILTEYDDLQRERDKLAPLFGLL